MKIHSACKAVEKQTHSPALLVGMQTDTTCLKGQLVILNKSTHALTLEPSYGT